jgi:hypothetical protein
MTSSTAWAGNTARTARWPRLLPLSVDGLILAASLVLRHEASNDRDAPALARFMLWLGIVATIGANVAYGAGYGPLAALRAPRRPAELQSRRLVFRTVQQQVPGRPERVSPTVMRASSHIAIPP